MQTRNPLPHKSLDNPNRVSSAVKRGFRSSYSRDVTTNPDVSPLTSFGFASVANLLANRHANGSLDRITTGQVQAAISLTQKLGRLPSFKVTQNLVVNGVVSFK